MPLIPTQPGSFDDPGTTWRMDTIYDFGCQHPHGMTALWGLSLYWWDDTTVGYMTFNDDNTIAYNASIGTTYPDQVLAVFEGFVVTSDASGANSKLWGVATGATAGDPLTWETLAGLPAVPDISAAAICAPNGAASGYFVFMARTDTGAQEIWLLQEVSGTDFTGTFDFTFVRSIDVGGDINQSLVAADIENDRIYVAGGPDRGVYVAQLSSTTGAIDDWVLATPYPDEVVNGHVLVASIAVDNGALLLGIAPPRL